MSDAPKPAAKKPASPKLAAKTSRLVETVTPDGREYLATPDEAVRLNRTAGYKIKN